MDFPHLQNATAFPDTDTRVYEQYRNVFDYNVWTPNTKIKLCRVNWFDDYHDVVKFPDDDSRDAWFDKLEGETVKLTTNMYIARADTDGIKLPVPYMTAQQYNYIIVDFSHDIINTPYQKADVQTRYHFFITNVRAEAPNTTTCAIERDVWTDYINNTTINGLLLSRGHAPLTETTPQELLKNPRANCRDFTLPDVDYGSAATNIKKSTPVNLQNGTRYICLATTFSPQQLRSMSNIHGTDATGSAPEYTNVDETVNGFAWTAGNINTSNVGGIGTSYNSIDNLTTSNVHMYALESSKISDSYFDALFIYYPHIASQIVSVFVATANMIRLDSTIKVNNIDWHVVNGARAKLADINLSANDFGYTPEYAQITRLYLAPYAHLEISDNIGNKTRVEIADCGHLSVQTVTSLSYPILRQIAWLDGIGADGNTSITINAIDGADITADVPNADMLKTLISHDIPTYALQRRAIDAQRAETYNRNVSQARENAILAYENTAKASNGARYNATDSADTSRTNANAANNASAYATQRNNRCRSDTTGIQIQTASDVTNRNLSMITHNSAEYLSKLGQDYAADQLYASSQYTADMEGVAATTANSMAASISGTALTVGGIAAGGALTVASGGTAAPAAVAAVGAMASNAINVGQQGYSAAVYMSKNYELLQASMTNLARKYAAAKTYNANTTSQSISAATDTTNRQNQAAADTTNTNNAAASDITANNVAIGNANAGRTRDTTVNNANRTRDITTYNAKRVLTNARGNADATWRDLLNHPARPVGAYGGDNFTQATGLDTMTVKIITQDNGAIAAAGDYMLRYGVASNKLYNRPALTVCRHYTYWQSADIWITCPFAQNTQLQALRNIFEAGVTIWGKPEEVGGDFVHDNL